MPLEDLRALLEQSNTKPSKFQRPPKDEPKKGYLGGLWESAKEGVGKVVEKAKEELPNIAPSVVPGIPKGIFRTAGELGEQVYNVGEKALEPVVDKAMDVAKKVSESPVLPAGIKPAFELGKALLGTEAAQKAMETGSETIQKANQAYEEWKARNPEPAKDLEAAVGILKGAATVAPIAEGVGPALKVAKKGVGKIGSLFEGKAASSIDDVIKQADEGVRVTYKLSDDALGSTPSQLRAVAEETAPKVSIVEKWAGIRPDIKKRIQGKYELMKDYFDAAHARNLDDTMPTVLDYASQRVGTARDTLKKVLDDTGSEIGKFRMSIADKPIPQEGYLQVLQKFDDELKKLNLSVGSDGQIIRAKGKVAGLVSDSEVKTLQELYDDIGRVAENPNMENLIQLRNAFSNKINFAKSAQQASNVVDPISRSVRGVIRDVNLNVIGKKQGALLDKYSDLMELLDELNRFVDSRSGAEFLLKRVLSERGRVPREVMKALKDATGIDLMDDATMAQIATELIGNEAQKGLFRQEIAKAGIDAMDIIDLATLSPGSGIRAAKTLLQKGKDVIADPEKTFLKAAKQKR